MKHLVLKNKKNQVVRVFYWDTNKAFVVYREKLKRLDIWPQLDFYKDEKFILIKEIQKSQLSKPLALSSSHFIELCDPSKESLSLSIPMKQLDLQYFWKSMGLVSSLFVFCAGILFFFKGMPSDQPEKIEQKIVKIIKPQLPEKVKVNSYQLYARSSAVTKPLNKKVIKKSLKRMSALGALGHLSKDQTLQKGGLNLTNSKISQGPGLRALAANGGSGGVQSSVYSKGLITVALGAGGNVKGGGGYVTKGGSHSGGGEAGYGQLNLVGSAGSADLSESSTLNSEGGYFDPNLIHQAISQKVGEVRNCYDEALKIESDLKGIFSADFVINNRGVVRSSKMHSESAIQSKKIAQCILKVLNTVKFNISSQTEPIRVIYKFDLIALGEGG